MPQEVEAKQCPRCKALAALTAPYCLVCGRKYNTQFTPDPPPPLPTLTGNSNNKTQSTIAPPAPPASPAPPAPPASPAPPVPAVHASPLYPNAPLVAAGSNSYLLEECARQYRHMNLYIILSIVGFFTGPFALAAFGYSHLVGKPGIRRRIAEMGIDPVAWAAPMDAIFGKAAKVALIAVAALVGGFITILTIGSIGYRLTAPQAQTQKEDDGLGSEQHYYGPDGRILPKSQEPRLPDYPGIPGR